MFLHILSEVHTHLLTCITIELQENVCDTTQIEKKVAKHSHFPSSLEIVLAGHWVIVATGKEGKTIDKNVHSSSKMHGRKFKRHSTHFCQEYYH